jgi:osmotically-inducible protein OsmY
MKTYRFAFWFGLASLALAGCGNTAEGMKEDSAQNTQKSAAAAEKMSANTATAGKNVQAATVLTPKVKLAILAEPRLTSTTVINVNSTEDVVTLEGHVANASLKTLAGDIAARVLKENNSHQTLSNKLVIQP